MRSHPSIFLLASAVMDTTEIIHISLVVDRLGVLVNAAAVSVAA
jgi:hypothetical protein